MSKSAKRPPPLPGLRLGDVDPEKTLAVPAPKGSQSQPQWVAANALLDSGEHLEPTEEDIPIDVVEDGLIGQTLGKYQLHGLLGQGGMGKVYLAEHTRIGRKVAIKLLRPKYARRREIVHRFFQEARTVNQIRHQNIVEINDFVEAEDKAGHTFLVMELLEGENLGEFMRLRRSIVFERAINIFIQICDALHAAHQVGVVHRDLKPDNVFLIPRITPWGEQTDFVKLFDFGVAKLMGDVVTDGLENAVIGTPAYMSPEQAAAGEVDHRADIYSLGAIMYRVLCGRPVFQATTIEEYVKKHMYEVPVPPSQVAEELQKVFPKEVEVVILKCLEKRREDRYQSALQLRDELIELQIALAPTDGFDEDELQVPPPKRRTGLWAALAILFILGGAAAGLHWSGLLDQWLFGQRQPEAPRSDPSAVAKPAARPAPDTPPLAPKEIELYLKSRPLGAEVYRVGEKQGKPLGVTPFRMLVPPQDQRVEFLFRLRGYRDETVAASLNENGEIVAELEKKKVPRGKKKRKKPGAEDSAAKTKPPGDVDKTQTLDPFSR